MTVNEELVRLEERIANITRKMSECHRVMRLAREAEEELEQLRVELKNAMAEYTAELESRAVRFEGNFAVTVPVKENIC